MKTKVSATLAILGLLTLAGPGCYVAGETRTGTEVKNLTLTPGQPVTVSFRDSDGDVRFVPGSDNALTLTVRKETTVHDADRAKRLLDEIKVEVEQTGNNIRIVIRRPSRVHFVFFGWSERVRVQSEVVLPKECALTAATSDGSITAEGLKGEISLKTSDGDIRLTDAQGRLTAHASDGDILLRSVRGEVESRTSDGHIELSGVLTALNLRTSDGDISARVEPGSQMSGSWKITASDGTIEAALPPEFNADLWLHTSDGEITCGLPLTVEGKTSPHDLRGTLGQGGPLFEIRTSDGDIRLVRAPGA